MTPFPIILSAPSGAGKTTVVRRLLETRGDLGKTISATTRARREHERDGIDYYFVSLEEFSARRARDEFAEFAQVHDQWYGTLRTELSRVLESGRHVVMEIDVQGGRAIQRAFPGAVLVFILPPSVEALVSRLRNRKTEADAVIARRLQSALIEIEAVSEYDYVVVNDTVDAAAARVSAIVDAEMARVTRLHGVKEQAAALIAELRRGMPAHVQENDDASVYPG